MSLEERKISILAAWLQKAVIPITDPFHEGEARRLPSPKATARFIIELLEAVDYAEMARHYEMVGEYQRD